jgi:polysaccharide pyruvyl transferase WcaK-like protein
MRILVDNAGYLLQNLGDVAMLQVAVRRLRRLWPEASIEVLTDRPERLAEFCPGVRPLSGYGRYLWFKDGGIFRGLGRLTPTAERGVRCRYPTLATSLMKTRHRRRRADAGEIYAFLDALRGADLHVATGGGYITDAFEYHAMRALDTIRIVKRRGKPAVIVGQGLGPIRSPALRANATAALPMVDLIALREHRAAAPLLDRLGVDAARVVTTGDDAIELSYDARDTDLGAGIGVNLRVAFYAEVDRTVIERARAALHDAGEAYGVPLLPVPISHVEGESDVETLRLLLAGVEAECGGSECAYAPPPGPLPDAADGGSRLVTPLDVIRQVGRCRLVVTGSYHAGVFALSQGIPVVALARSAYYRDKFLGLADQFSVGCEVIRLDDDTLRSKLRHAIDHTWRTAENVRPHLLRAAARQIELGHATYRRLCELV